MPLPCSDHAALQTTSQGHGRGTVCYASRRPVGDLSSFGFFHLPRGVSRLAFRGFPSTRGLSRRTRHCRRKAGARHGMCELVKHGTAGAQHSMCELARHGTARKDCSGKRAVSLVASQFSSSWYPHRLRQGDAMSTVLLNVDLENVIGMMRQTVLMDRDCIYVACADVLVLERLVRATGRSCNTTGIGALSTGLLGNGREAKYIRIIKNITNVYDSRGAGI